MYRMLAATAEFQRDLIIVNTREGLAAARCINKLEGYRAVASRYDKRTTCIAEPIDIASTRIWLRNPIPIHGTGSNSAEASEVGERFVSSGDKGPGGADSQRDEDRARDLDSAGDSGGPRFGLAVTVPVGCAESTTQRDTVNQLIQS